MIDTKRLETDAAYWDKVAPKGATHYFQAGNGYRDGFYRNLNGGKPEFYGHDGWSVNCDNPLTTCRAFIPRPTKPAAPEWDGEGYPPVGCECEMYPYFHKCRIVCEYMNGLVVHDLHDDKVIWLPSNKANNSFRPIRTKEQREREELIELAFSTVQKIPSTESAITAVVDAIIAAGWTKP